MTRRDDESATVNDFGRGRLIWLIAKSRQRGLILPLLLIPILKLSNTHIIEVHFPINFSRRAPYLPKLCSLAPTLRFCLLYALHVMEWHSRLHVIHRWPIHDEQQRQLSIRELGFNELGQSFSRQQELRNQNTLQILSNYINSNLEDISTLPRKHTHTITQLDKLFSSFGRLNNTNPIHFPSLSLSVTSLFFIFRTFWLHSLTL